MIKACPELTEMGAVVKGPMARSRPARRDRRLVLLSYARRLAKRRLHFAVKMPGDAGTTFTVCGADAPLLRVTTMFAVPLVWPDGSTLNGSCALICPALT
jgi:hypothetical protein